VCASDAVASQQPALAARGSEDPAAAQLERGNALAVAGDPAGALQAYRESRQQALAGGDAQLATLADANAARAALEAGQLDALEGHLERVAAALEEVADPHTRIRLRIHVARTYAGLSERLPASRVAPLRARELLARAARSARDAGDTRNESYAVGYLGELYERRGRHAEALELTRRALRAAMAADAPDALYRWQWQVGRIQRARAGSDEALAAYRQAVATVLQLREQTAASGAGFDAQLANTGELYGELVDLLLAREARSQRPAERQALLAEALEVLESQKLDELRDYFGDECLAAQRRAAPDEIPGALIVYPIALPDRLELVVGGAGELERHGVPIGRETLTSEVRAFRHAVVRRTTREHLRHGKTLYDWLIRPIETTLRQRKPRTIVFVPGGALRTIPFGALWDAETGQYLVERLPVAIIPGLTLIDPRPLARGRIRLLAAGISEAVEGYPPLPSVVNEIEAVHEAFPGRTLVDEEFVIDRFVREIESRPFDIVHVASHGEFSDDPSKSFLLAYDGKISLERLARVVGMTRFRTEQPLELLALSACETAAGSERAALGLAGIAVRAGARSALATLWSVNDEATAALVSAFYRNLEDPALSRAQALRQAQLEFVSTRALGHPAFWAPFVLINSWL
jgi:CHAT domain-containing protein